MKHTSMTTSESRKPVYADMVENIRRRIENGEVSEGEYLASEHELAASTGISRDSVRRGIQTLIVEGLVERRPGRGLFVRSRETQSTMIQIVVRNLEDNLQVQVARGAQSLGADRGIGVQIYDSHRHHELALNILRGLPDTGFSGAIVTGPAYAGLPEALMALKRVQFPFVMIDERLSGFDVSSVTSDNHRGGYLLGEHLLGLGHRRIGFVTRRLEKHETVRRRVDGLRDAICDAGLPFDRSLIAEMTIQPSQRYWRDEIERATRELTDRPEPPTAIFCCNDGVAADVYRILKAMGKRIPEDISVVGFDDDPIAAVLDPPLTTIRQDVAGLGRAAMELLLEQIGGTGKGRAENQVMPVELVERASVERISD